MMICSLKNVLVSFFILFLSMNSFAGNDTALVVIDFQPEMWTRTGQHKKEGNVEKLKQMKAAVLQSIEMAKKEKLPIILVQFENSGPVYSEVTDALKGYPNGKTIFKDSDGIFESDGLMTKKNSYKEDFIQHLKKEKIKNLVMIGANGWACVRSSMKGALENNYNVIAFDKATADFNSDNFKYPYVNDYRLNNVICDNCSFRRVREFQDLSLIFANSSSNDRSRPGVNVIDSNRSPNQKRLSPEEQSLPSKNTHSLEK